MKKGGLFIILMIVGCVLVPGCVITPKNNHTIEQPTAEPPSLIVGGEFQGLPYGQLNVSIGDYKAILPVFVDNISAGQVSAGEVLSLNVMEGSHTVKVCSGTICESVDVNIVSATRTTIDFEEKLNKDLPQGELIVSIGNYFERLPVFINNLSAGNVSPNHPLSRTLNAGYHTVKICTIEDCYTEVIELKPPNQTTVNFASRLKSEGRQADLIVSLGGYKSSEPLPVFIDNIEAGVASMGNPLRVNINTGIHEVKVCAGSICPTGGVEVRFGKQNYIDFGETLTKEAEFINPTVRIVDYSLGGNTLLINTEYINPGSTALIMTPTFSCVYSYLDAQHTRVSSSVRGQLTQVVPAYSRTKDTAYLYLSEGYAADYIMGVPVIVDVRITNYSE